jgi:hypothetical protein
MTKKAGPVVQSKEAIERVHLVDERYKTARTVIRWAGLCMLMYLFMAGLAPLAGKETVVSFALSILADFKFALSVALAGAATAWALVERKLRQRKTEYFQDRIRRLETQVDPRRSTSGLTREGKTNPNDRSE